MKRSSLLRQIIPLLLLNFVVASVGFSYSYEWGLIGLTLALGFTGLWMWLRFSRPLSQLLDEIQSVTAKGFSTPNIVLNAISTREISDLGKSLIRLAKRLNKRIETIEMHSNEKDAILSSMSEGVIVVHKDERILLLNHEAQSILKLPDFSGRPDVQTIVRIPQLVDFIRGTLETQIPSEDELEIMIDNKRLFIRVTSRPLKVVSKKKGGGVVIVLTDVTRVRELEAHRQEFVANVSHELRTPLTSIQGFAETLLSTNVDEEQQKRFVAIIQKHAGRLNNIIEDILALSRLEREEKGEDIQLAEGSVLSVLESAAELCSVKAQKANVHLNVSGSPDLQAPINGPLLEQAVVNLIDNAIKYSKEGGDVDISCSGQGDQLAITVKDDGDGVPTKDLPRLFERFYRVDKARCRANGGTGLGLSIVKHIAMAHKGQVGVESEVGRGSEFTVILPTNQGPSNTTLIQP